MPRTAAVCSTAGCWESNHIFRDGENVAISNLRQPAWESGRLEFISPVKSVVCEEIRNGIDPNIQPEEGGKIRLRIGYPIGDASPILDRNVIYIKPVGLSSTDPHHLLRGALGNLGL